MQTYTLSNGQKVDLKGFIEAIQSIGEFPQYLLDIQTGNVCIVESQRSMIDLIKKTGKSVRYIPIAQLNERGYRSLMKDFLEEVVKDSVPPKKIKYLKSLMKKEGWRAVVKEFEAGKDRKGCIFRWNQFLAAEAAGFAQFLLAKVPGVSMSMNANICANCPFCQGIGGLDL